MPTPHTTAQQLARLRNLNARLTRVIRSFETVAANRDPQTGTFKAGSSISGKSLRTAWQLTPREKFKNQLLAALRMRPTATK